MKIITIDKEKFNKFVGTYRDFHTTNDKFAEDKMRAWASYLNVGKNEKIYKFVMHKTGIKWIVKQ